MIESALTDLPLPDSPTSPSVWPAPSSKSTPSTARIGRPPDRNHVLRFSTRSSSAMRAPRAFGDELIQPGPACAR